MADSRSQKIQARLYARLNQRAEERDRQILAGQARNRELMMQHRLAKNHQHRENMERLDQQSVEIQQAGKAVEATVVKGNEVVLDAIHEDRQGLERSLQEMTARYQEIREAEKAALLRAGTDGNELLLSAMRSERRGLERQIEKYNKLLVAEYRAIREEDRLAAEKAQAELLQAGTAGNNRVMDMIRENEQQRKQERDKDVRIQDDLRVWEAERQEAFQQKLLARDEQRELERREERAAWAAEWREAEERRLAREAAMLEAQRKEREEFLRIQEATLESTIKKALVDNSMPKEDIEAVKTCLAFVDCLPKTATTGASTTTGSTAPPTSIAVFEKENADPQKKSAEVRFLEAKLREAAVDKRKDEEEKVRLQKRLEMEERERLRIERQQRGKTRSERIESKKPEETAQGRRATEAAAFDKAKKQEGWRRSTRLRDGNPVKHGKPTYR